MAFRKGGCGDFGGEFETFVTSYLDRGTEIHLLSCMKTITINVSEPVYRDFREYALKTDRKASELIREAMELFRQQHMQRRTSLRDRRPVSVGGSIQAITQGLRMNRK